MAIGMNQRIDWQKFWQDFDENPDDVEGLIWKNKDGKWVLIFSVPGERRDLAVHINYNPWTGKELT